MRPNDTVSAQIRVIPAQLRGNDTPAYDDGRPPRGPAVVRCRGGAASADLLAELAAVLGLDVADELVAVGRAVGVLAGQAPLVLVAEAVAVGGQLPAEALGDLVLTAGAVELARVHLRLGVAVAADVDDLAVVVVAAALLEHRDAVAVVLDVDAHPGLGVVGRDDVLEQVDTAEREAHDRHRPQRAEDQRGDRRPAALGAVTLDLAQADDRADPARDDQAARGQVEDERRDRGAVGAALGVVAALPLAVALLLPGVGLALLAVGLLAVRRLAVLTTLLAVGLLRLVAVLSVGPPCWG